jgi:hypothetical protein
LNFAQRGGAPHFWYLTLVDGSDSTFTHDTVSVILPERAIAVEVNLENRGKQDYLKDVCIPGEYSDLEIFEKRGGD